MGQNKNVNNNMNKDLPVWFHVKIVWQAGWIAPIQGSHGIDTEHQEYAENWIDCIETSVTSLRYGIGESSSHITDQDFVYVGTHSINFNYLTTLFSPIVELFNIMNEVVMEC